MLTKLSLNSYNYTVGHFVVPEEGLRSRDNFELNTPYQRGSVWTENQRVALVKSLLLGLPIGSVVLNHRGFQAEKLYAVVDGKQRIEAIRAFFNSEFAVPAEWFAADGVRESFTDTDGTEKVFFSGLGKIQQHMFENSSFPALEAHVKSVAEEAEIFLLINSGGTAQTEADLTKAAGIAKAK
jgi:hypothetical protein